MLTARVGGHRRGSPRYSYNAGCAGLVDEAGYRHAVGGWVFASQGFCEKASRGALKIFINHVRKKKTMLVSEGLSGLNTFVSLFGARPGPAVAFGRHYLFPVLIFFLR